MKNRNHMKARISVLLVLVMLFSIPVSVLGSSAGTAFESSGVEVIVVGEPGGVDEEPSVSEPEAPEEPETPDGSGDTSDDEEEPEEDEEPSEEPGDEDLDDGPSTDDEDLDDEGDDADVLDSLPQVSGSAAIVYTGASGFVQRLYQNILGRNPSASEIKGHAEYLETGKRTAAETVQVFLNSGEFQKKNTSNEEYVRILYSTILNRSPDKAGLESHVSDLNDRLTREFVLRSFIASGEFKKLCEGYGISEVGSVTLTEYRDKHPDATRFVARLYRVILQRGFTGDEMNVWVEQAVAGTGAGQIVYGFVNSTEFKNRNYDNETYVRTLYRSMFDRSPDSAGFKNHMSELADGVTRNTILVRFTASGEFARLCEKYGMKAGSIDNRLTVHDKNPEVAKFVVRLYRNILDRGANTSEVGSWVEALVSGRSAAQVAYDFTQSGEFQNKKLSDEDYVRVLYNTLLGRSPDSTGMKQHTGDLAKGGSRDYVFNNFVYSSEFSRICASFGMTVGTANLKNVVKPGSGSSSGTLTVRYNGENVTDTIENILVKTVYAEVGGFKNTETFKAQAVAAYTYIMYYANRGQVASLPLRDPPSSVEPAIRSAVKAVLGVYVSYNNTYALTAYSAANNGTTNPSGDIWTTSLPYLTAVESKAEQASGFRYKNYNQSVSLTVFKSQMKKYYPNITLTGEPTDWIKLTTSKYGYVTGITICGQKVNVETFYQNMFGLLSPSFTISYDVKAEKFNFVVNGYGHGVGMSQYGADYYASIGWSYEKILAHYYPGTTLKK